MTSLDNDEFSIDNIINYWYMINTRTKVQSTNLNAFECNEKAFQRVNEFKYLEAV